jgi:hypothetical protein
MGLEIIEGVVCLAVYYAIRAESYHEREVRKIHVERFGVLRGLS